MIPDEVVERVRESADIVQVIGEFVKLKRVGTSWRGPCPFHQGKDPNFSVSPRGGYHCFVCHEKGDVFTFVQKRLGLDFVDAVKHVGAKAGVEVVEVSRERSQGPDPRERFWEINAAAAEFFKEQLWGDGGAEAREYLESRGYGRAEADRFGMGFAPRDAAALSNHLGALGYDPATLTTAGLMVVREEGEEPRVRFRGRLMFPIYDAQSRVIAFGGRVIDQREPKYLNSPESPTFLKSQTLYGLNWARPAIRRDGRVVLVEGYFDCVRLLTAGLECVVAPMGTALTEAQATQIKRMTNDVFLLYDSDQAGLKATFRAGDMLLAQGCKVQVVTLPEGEDPDTFVRQHGREGIDRHIAGAIDVLERKIRILELGGWFGDLRRKRSALDRMLPTMRAATDPITRSLYLARAAEVIGIATDVLEREVRSSPARQPADAPKPAAQGRAPDRADQRRTTSRERFTTGSAAERELVRVLLHRRQNIARVVERLPGARFREPALGEIFAALTAHPDATIESLAATLQDAAVARVDELLAQDRGLDDPVRVIDDCIAMLKRRDLGDRLTEIDRELPLASDKEKDRLMDQKRQLMTEIRGLGGGRWKTFGEARQ